MLELNWTQPPNDYPTSDGKPVAETDIHRDQLFDCLYTLKHYFKDLPQVNVTGNMLWFYQRNDKRRHLSPDVMVSFGIPKGRRENYLQWEEGTAPQVVFEFTSKSTSADDLGHKREHYERLGVEEYYLFDPREEYLVPRFRTYMLHSGRFMPVLGETVYSNRLGLEVVVVDDVLRFRVPGTGEILPTPDQRAQEAFERAEQESARAEQESARAEQECARAEQERARAEQERARADEAVARAAEAERKLEELKRLLEKSSRDSPDSQAH